MPRSSAKLTSSLPSSSAETVAGASAHPDGCPVLRCPALSEYAVKLKDIKLKTAISLPDAEGNTVVSLTVPARCRSGNEILLPLSLCPSSHATASESCSSSSASHVVNNGAGNSNDRTVVVMVMERNSDDEAPSPVNENMIRILPQNNSVESLGIPGFHAIPTAGSVQASAVSVLTEPLPHSRGQPAFGTSDRFPAAPVPFMGSQHDGVVGVETPVLRCTARPLFIPYSRQSSTVTPNSGGHTVGSSTASGCISVLSTPTLSSMMADGSPGSNYSRPSPRPHACYVCNESHATAAALYTHLEVAHNEKPKNLFTCDKCDASFLRRYRYHEHVHAYHTGDGDRQFNCEVPGCGKRYRYRRHLRRHMRIHGDVNEFRRHECDICGKRFPRVSQRDEHRNIHTGDKPFACDLCGSSYSHSSTLWLHRKRHESGKIDDEGRVIPGAGGRDDDDEEDDDDVDVLNASGEPCWQAATDRAAAAMASSMGGRQQAAGGMPMLPGLSAMEAATSGNQSVIVRSVEALNSSAQVLVSYSESDLI